MPRAALRQTEIDDFRAAVCAAARRLFAEQGYEAVTMRAIARALGCSAMTPYRYFPGGKGEIFAAVKADAYHRLAAASEATLAATPDLLERLEALARTYVGFAVQHRDAYRIMFELDQEDDAAHPEVLAAGVRSWKPFQDTVAALVARRGLSVDPVVLAHLVWARVHGLVTLHLAGKLRLGRELPELLEALIAEEGARFRAREEAHEKHHPAEPGGRVRAGRDARRHGSRRP